MSCGVRPGTSARPKAWDHWSWSNVRAKIDVSASTVGPMIHSGWKSCAVASFVTAAGVSGSPV